MIDPPRWRPIDLGEAKEGPSETVRTSDSIRKYLLTLLGGLLAAFALGVLLGSFCMGIFVSVNWFMEWIK